jgi:type VI secretion system secreted protein VgrG
VHAEKDQDIRIKHDRFEWVGHNRHLVVKQDKFEHVENNSHLQIDKDRLEYIKQDHNLSVGGKQADSIATSHSFTVAGDVIEIFKSNHNEYTAGSYYLKAKGIVIEAMTGITLKCGGSHLVVDPSGVTLKGALVTLDGSQLKIASGPGSPPTPGMKRSAVKPAAPEAALEADNADPGKVSQAKVSKAQQQRAEIPFKPSSFVHEEKSRVEIELTDEEGNPVAGEKYKITLPDGSVKTGTLDQNGYARVAGIDPGTCEVTFPNLDKDAWDKT